MSTIVITPQVVKSVIEKRFNLNQLPLNSELREFELKDADLLQLRVAFVQSVWQRCTHSLARYHLQFNR